MTGSEFYDYVLNIFKRTDKSTEVYEAITDVIMDVKLRYFFEDFKEEAYSTSISVLGDYKISLPSDFGHIIGDVTLIDDTGNSRTLRKRSKEYFDRKYPDMNASDVQRALPEDFCIFSGQMLIGSMPDSVSYIYQFNYSTEAATEIDANTASVPFTDRYRWIIRALVLAELYEGLGFDTEAAKFKAKGEQGVGFMVANDEFNIDALEHQEYSDL